jgi:hypothetical protein
MGINPLEVLCVKFDVGLLKSKNWLGIRSARAEADAIVTASSAISALIVAKKTMVAICRTLQACSYQEGHAPPFSKNIFNSMHEVKKQILDRFLYTRSLTDTGNATLNFTSEQMRLLETTNLFSIGEKIELFLVSTGDKLTTEIDKNITYISSAADSNLLTPNMMNVTQIQKFLGNFPFAFHKKSRLQTKNGTKKRLTWFQVSLNNRVDAFMKKYSTSCSEMEDGILYGFPLSAIRAFAGFIDITEGDDRKTSALYYLAGV